jgi:hypothetical protein
MPTTSCPCGCAVRPATIRAATRARSIGWPRFANKAPADETVVILRNIDRFQNAKYVMTELGIEI